MPKVPFLAVVPVLVTAGIVVLALFGLNRADPEGLPSAREGGIAPALEITALGGKPIFGAKELAGDGVKFVNFWASWCGPCRVEHPTLMQLADEGFPVYGVNYKDQEANALAFLDELGDPYSGVGVDGRGRVGLDWGIFGVPETFVIDDEGVIVLRFAGPVTQRVLEEKIRPAIAAAQAK